MKVTKSSAF